MTPRCDDEVFAYTSVSTWSQPHPAPLSDHRLHLVQGLAQEVTARASGRIRIAIDGPTAAGKTSFGHELASEVRTLGRSTLRASLDDFKQPWRDRHLYDRESPQGYYDNAQDQNAVVELLLRPAGPDGDGRVVLCSIDPLTQDDHRAVVVQAPDDAVLIVDGVFAQRPAYAAHWDFAVWLDVTAEVAERRMVVRDGAREGREQARQLHNRRYAPSERLYISDVNPYHRADFVVDNSNLERPRRLR